MTAEKAIIAVIQGTVQGVGFRPFVYRLAAAQQVQGSIRNTADGVEVRVRGTAARVDAFLAALPEKCPPQAVIRTIECSLDPEPAPSAGFIILPSRQEAAARSLFPPDLALCDACRRELHDPGDRRFHYPFINCTNCGPRFSLVKELPYDRCRTSMADFELCPACAREYHDPTDRRFHAEPLACPVCGPRLSWLDDRGRQQRTADPLATAAAALRAGKIVALKGLGGFHLAVDATSSPAVARLRQRKQRPHKPLAIMVKDLEAARRLCRLSAAEEAILGSPQAPIVLLETHAGSILAPEVAPGIAWIGVMLPYTPLHELLLTRPDTPDFLVMTSGNISDEPICRTDAEAVERLAAVADGYLVHNREIVMTADDSLGRCFGDQWYLFRRARGYVPAPISLPLELPPVLAMGAELKATFCLASEQKAILSQHLGDLADPRSEDFCHFARQHLQKLLHFEPQLVACDQHPDYRSTRLARELDLPVLPVQHHHAHAAAVMAEHGLVEPVLAVILDGTGYHPDGTIWGGELLLAAFDEYRRLGHLEPFPLPGGDQAAREPWRLAAALLQQRWGPDFPRESPWLPPGWEELHPLSRQLVASMITRQLNTPLTSSCGRLFDAIAALTGSRYYATYEGQAAMELESLAGGWQGENEIAESCYPVLIGQHHGQEVVKLAGMLDGICQDLRHGLPPARAARRFHFWFINAFGRLISRTAAATGIDQVVFGGGCLQNGLLVAGFAHYCRHAGLRAYFPRQAPANDGGLALGQAMVAGITAAKT
ncbi:MAG: carbamoyltransferase HypF [Deltaproteobacteria bacterium]|nr:carbamoyltransferase HypF [Deltaproteobacteria bacterium]